MVVNRRRDSALYLPLGVSGLDKLQGFVREEFVRELQGEQYKRIIKEMSEQDPTCGAVLYAVESLIRKTKWEVVPPDESLESEKWAEFFKGCFFQDMSYSWEDILAEIISFLEWGWSYLEMTYKPRNGENPGTIPMPDGRQYPLPESQFDDGLIGWHKWEIRSQDTLYNWEYDEFDSFKGMNQQAPPSYARTLIPIEKSLHFKTTSRKANPEGKSILRRAYLPWYFKKNIQRIEGIGIERDLAGLPMAQVPPELLGPTANLTPAQVSVRDALLTLVTQVRRDSAEGILFPLAYDDDGHELYKFSLLSSGGSRQFDTTTIVRRYDESIAMTMLADFIFLGSNGVGSYALASSKTNLFTVALGSFMDAIQQVINQFAIPRLAKLNSIPKEYWPALQHGDIETVDLMELGSYISQVAGAGFDLTSIPNMLNHLMSQAGLPVPGEGQTLQEGDAEPTDEELDALNAAENDGALRDAAVAAGERYAFNELMIASQEILDQQTPSDEDVETYIAEQFDQEIESQRSLRQFHLKGEA